MRPVSIPEDQKTKWIIYSLHFSTWMTVVLFTRIRWIHFMANRNSRRRQSRFIVFGVNWCSHFVGCVFCVVRTNASVKSEFYLQTSHKFRMMHQKMEKMECKVKLLMLYALPLSSIYASCMCVMEV